ncbi:transcription like zf-ZZ type zinc finger protein [Schizosaccharomyces cryophilus OY26]|uniref:Transcription like zf-ZZ type zinc finger protein n=1 Tax=Schizosaccharomyces cryophilus (strain OY26 / ATCC MYA-4695 / CBS 11777 / NBRC 106824 / NRRL Y48691) TaxID=653667 RepID=S9XB06_SCHCR|nr:transcription like zf-ZZ type zinc finger protein [Schizosaccharomyces cryophilus OY26]EPY54317.1 transcription like zf-ZZ type zinc finger protein [Schizosaccharomyces cryophilus OY26]
MCKTTTHSSLSKAKNPELHRQVASSVEHLNNKPVFTEQPSSVACNSCLKLIQDQVYFHCKDCLDFDICRSCYNNQTFSHSCLKASFERVIQTPKLHSLSTSPSVLKSSDFMYSICDACEQPIRNLRLKCGTCDDYDLCDSCFRSNDHSKIHNFVRITKAYPYGISPFQLPPSFSSDTDFARTSLVHRSSQCDSCQAHPIVGNRYKCLVCKDFDLCSECISHTFHFHHEMLCLSRFSTSFPPSDSKPKELQYDFQLVRDYLLPVNPGPNVSCMKIWQLKNISLKTWPAPLYLRFNGGDRLTRDEPLSILPIAHQVQPGESALIALSLRIPPVETTKKTFFSFFQLITDSGDVFHKNLCFFYTTPRTDE